MSAPFAAANVEIRTKAQIQELRNAVAAFKEGKIELSQLKKVTSEVKTSTDDYNKAIRTLNRTVRLQNFELMEAHRVVRGVSTLFNSLNQIYQTFILRQIEANQRTFEQQRAFEKVSDLARNLIDNTNTLGDANIDVQRQVDALTDALDSLTSKQLLDLRSEFIQARLEAETAGKSVDGFNDVIKKLDEQLKITKPLEKGKEFQDFFGNFTQIGAIVGDISLFVLALAQFRYTLVRLLPVLIKVAGPLGAVIGLLAGKEFVQTAGEKSLDQLFEKHPAGPPGGFNLADFFARLGPPGTQEVNINLNGPVSLSNTEDLFRWAQIVIDKINEENSKGRR